MLTRIEDLRSRYVYQFLDAVITAPARRADSDGHGRQAVQAGSRNYRRAHRLLANLGGVLPRALEAWQERLFDPSGIPFGATHVRCLSFGSAVTAYLVRVPGRQGSIDVNVLKVYRKSLGRRPAELVDQVCRRRAMFKRVATWYDNCAVVLPTVFVVLHGPLLAKAAAASMQPYVAGRHADLFEDLSESELVDLLSCDAGLRNQFASFVDRTVNAAESEHAAVDLVGRNNLVLVQDGGRRRLVLLDYGIFDFEYKAARAPRALADLRARLDYLRQLRRELPLCESARHAMAADNCAEAHRSGS